MAYRLTAALRDRLKTPFGKLYRCNSDTCLRDIVRSYRSLPKVIAIGDVTAYHLLRAGIVPDMCIVDDMTMRLPVDYEIRKGTAHESFKDIVVKNPAGVVSQELIDAIKDNMLSRGHVRIFVDGEEDLAVIPACEYAPVGSLVLYGQPNEGVVAVEVTPEKKRETLLLMQQMVKE
ncbi:MAG TPA: GTP-dependent dephospho-CoA kinase family protein [Methanocella sp.]|uniref:GTP-dependent dephospho-CoA kinase family protein n=1 Tax=Methanocella sp. TaxID=2052833 RepID=UPI002C77C088|nr:GTP-dependent dephospho-CoA kinase family protein [Methanocella sp.]HTY90236.1 GTP-dependent dephospho-CoA kinase family protein [Methanocella sp.]